MFVVQGSGAQANVQQEQADEREGPVEDRVAVLRRYGPNFPLPGGFLSTRVYHKNLSTVTKSYICAPLWGIWLPVSSPYFLSWQWATTSLCSASASGWTSTSTTRKGTPGWASRSHFHTGDQLWLVTIFPGRLDMSGHERTESDSLKWCKLFLSGEWACRVMALLWLEVKWPPVPWVLGHRYNLAKFNQSLLQIYENMFICLNSSGKYLSNKASGVDFCIIPDFWHVNHWFIRLLNSIHP